MGVLKRWVLCVFLVIILISQAVLAGGIDYQQKVLPNGMRLVYKAMPEAKTITVRIVVPVGFLNEPLRVSNISHLLEHLVFRGSEKYSSEDFGRQVTERGGYYNAFTMLDRTEYILETAPEDFSPGLEMYLDQIFNPSLSEDHIRLEKKIINVEKVLRDTPGDIYFFYVNELTAKRFSNSAQNITSNDLVNYHRQNYQLNKVTVIITGAFNLNETAKLLSAVKPLPAAEVNMVSDWKLNNPKNDIMLEDYLQGEEYQLLVSFPLEKLSRKDMLIAKVLPYILSYDSQNFDPVTGRALDYGIDLLKLGEHYFLVLIYRDCQNKYSEQVRDWHQKNLARYGKFLKAKKFDNFLNNLSRGMKKNFTKMEWEPAVLNDFYAQKIFDPAMITDEDLAGIRQLSTGDFRTFVQKYLEGKLYQKIVIKAL